MSKYINFTKEQREQARRTDLANFLISQGRKLRNQVQNTNGLTAHKKLQSEVISGIISTNKKAVMRLILSADFITRTMPKRWKCF